MNEWIEKKNTLVNLKHICFSFYFFWQVCYIEKKIGSDQLGRNMRIDKNKYKLKIVIERLQELLSFTNRQKSPSALCARKFHEFSCLYDK